VKREADNERTDIVLASKAQESMEVEAKIFPLQRVDALGCDSQGIAKCEADPPESDIKPKDASEVRLRKRQLVHYLSL
jgi:hypothetical protein